jgi:hypothetical protein
MVFYMYTLYPQKLELTSPTSGGRSVGLVRLSTKATGFVCFVLFGPFPLLISRPKFPPSNSGPTHTHTHTHRNLETFMLFLNILDIRPQTCWSPLSVASCPLALSVVTLSLPQALSRCAFPTIESFAVHIHCGVERFCHK